MFFLLLITGSNLHTCKRYAPVIESNLYPLHLVVHLFSANINIHELFQYATFSPLPLENSPKPRYI